TTINLDTPAGKVVCEVAVTDGHADSVTITNVPSFSERLDASVDVPGLGTVNYDLAFGGNFYAIVKLEELGIEFREDRANKDELLKAGLSIMDAINAAD